MFHRHFFCVFLVLPLLVVADPFLFKSDEGFSELMAHEPLFKFKDFSLTFGKKYGSLEEFNKRFEIFKNNLKTIDKLNREERGTAKYGITKFADLTYDEFIQNFTGGRISEAAWRHHEEAMEIEPELQIEFMDNNFGEFIQKHGHNGKVAEEEGGDIKVVGGKVYLPKKYDYRKRNAVTIVKNQQDWCGSCWAFSTIGNIEGVYAKFKKELINLSEQELVDCDKVNHGCGGGYMPDAVKELVRLGGVARTSDYPYEAHDGQCRFNTSMAVVKVAGTKSIPANEKKIARALIKNGPLSVAIDASAIVFYQSGVIDPSPSACSREKRYVNHALTLVAYGEERTSSKKKVPYWVMKNSYGQDFGEQGYVRFIRGKNACGLKAFVSTAYL